MKLLAIFALMLVIQSAAAAPPVVKNIGTHNGQPVDEFTLTNGLMTAKFISYGATLRELQVPDKSGKTADVVLGFDDLKGYTAGHPFFGAVAGRVANRIAKGKFTLDGKEYNLATNNGPNHLHGGNKGFDKKVWKGEIVPGKNAVKFTLRSPDGEEGYPGNLVASVTYTLESEGDWKIEYTATADKATPINLTQHAYFNLAGHAAGDILGHKLRLVADRYTPTDDTLIPTGELRAVSGTPFDFTNAKTIGQQIKETGITPVGYDHNFVRNATSGTTLVAEVIEPKSGRVMEVFTSEPGIQFYTGNFLDGKNIGKGGAVYKQHTGFCLECQHFPDAVNQPKFASVILRPSETYRQTTLYRFYAEK